MIFNRPSNLVLGAFTALFNVVVLLLASAHVPVSPELTGAVNLAAAAIITLVAGQPPTVNPGDRVHVTDNNGGATLTRVVQSREASRPVAALDRVGDPDSSSVSTPPPAP